MTAGNFGLVLWICVSHEAGVSFTHLSWLWFRGGWSQCAWGALKRARQFLGLWFSIQGIADLKTWGFGGHYNYLFLIIPFFKRIMTHTPFLQDLFAWTVERELFYLLGRSPKGLRLGMSEAESIHQELHLVSHGGRGSKHLSIFRWFLRCISKELDQKWSSQDSNMCSDMGYQLLQLYLT